MDPAARTQRILRQHVRTDQLLGVEAVPVGSVRPVVEVASASTKPVPSKPAKDKPAKDKPVATKSVKRKPPVAAATGDKPALLEQLDVGEVRGCTKCALHEARKQTVFGVGHPDADLMFVGEGPGQNEDEQGEPFVGKAGNLLTKMIVAMGLSRQTVYIANVVKCRPPNNRTPLPAEVATCTDYLHRQIDIIRPKVIVTLGNPATKHMLQTTRGITSTRGQWHQWHGLEPDGPAIDVMPTFHPAYLLRQYTRENREKVWSDLLAVLDKLGLPKPA